MAVWGGFEFRSGRLESLRHLTLRWHGMRPVTVVRIVEWPTPAEIDCPIRPNSVRIRGCPVETGITVTIT